jgi:hypothetical protein
MPEWKIIITGEAKGLKYGQGAVSNSLLIGAGQIWHAYDHVQ